MAMDKCDSGSMATISCDSGSMQWVNCGPIWGLQAGRGKVCAEDVRHALKASGDTLPEDELQGVFASLDTRGDGLITIDEFEAAALEAPHALNDARLKATFDFMDANGDGYAELLCSPPTPACVSLLLPASHRGAGHIGAGEVENGWC
jgi:EF-hand domain pair/EF hand